MTPSTETQLRDAYDDLLDHIEKVKKSAIQLATWDLFDDPSAPMDPTRHCRSNQGKELPPRAVLSDPATWRTQLSALDRDVSEAWKMATRVLSRYSGRTQAIKKLQKESTELLGKQVSLRATYISLNSRTLTKTDNVEPADDQKPIEKSHHHSDSGLGQPEGVLLEEEGDSDGDGDWSLSPNGDDYKDRNRESEKLIERLANSSAAVIGIAGPRGVGKSSLALRIEAHIARVANGFTVVMHVPTGHDAQEFVLSLFEIACDEAIRRTTEARNERLVTRYSVLYAPFFIGVTVGIALYFVWGVIVSTALPVLIHPWYAITPAVGMLTLPLAFLCLRRMAYEGYASVRRHALMAAQYIQYQTTQSTNVEAGLSVAKLRARLGGERRLSERPITLAGITERFARFLEQIADVYPGGVLICLDELDKIDDPNDVERLLRGVKGLFGRRRVYFVLTVSDDGLRRFSSRNQGDRGILESVFDDIVFLRLVGLDIADYILDRMYPLDDRRRTGRSLDSSTVLLWLFGNAIPREIKRNALSCLQDGILPRHVSTTDLWRHLLQRRIEDIDAWAVRESGTEERARELRRSLEATLDNIKPLSGCGGRDAISEQVVVSVWERYWEALIEDELDEKTNDGGMYGRACIQILVGLSGLAYACRGQAEGFSENSIQRLLSIFESMESDVVLAKRITREHLDDLGLVG